MKMNLRDLYITDNINSLESLAQRDDVIQGVKKSHRFGNLANKIMGELMQCQDDQEKCYILCRRYINLMDHLFKICDDQNYVKALHSSDYRKVKQLINEIRESLEERYKKLTTENENKHVKAPPPTMEIAPTPIILKRFNFKDHFIQPGDLFMILQREDNFLIVDIRPVLDFSKTKINLSKGNIINIPGELIVPGLSANTLGQRLESPAKELWDKRDTFDILILLDDDTGKHNYFGTVLSRLRNIIVEWDTRRKYPHKPVILNGGLKEFVQYYPIAVNNSHLFLKQINTEIDELLELENINYPENGAPLQMNLKKDTDFLIELDQVNRNSYPSTGIEVRSTNLEDKNSLDDLNIKKNVLPEPPVPISEEIGDLAIDKAVKELVKGEKAAQLLIARQALKPTFYGESKNEIAKREIPLKKEKRVRPRSPFIKPPSVDRSFKPVAIFGKGFTGLKNERNICYMNCLLQCLKVIPSIKAIYITSDQYLSYTTRMPPKINHHLAEVLRELWGGTAQRHRTFFISQFKNRICEFAPMYDNNTHEDCFEFFLFLFNAVSEDCSIDLPSQVMTESEKAWFGQLQGRSSFWIEMFYFQFKNMKVCCNCHKTNLSFDTEGLLLLPVPNKNCTLDNLISEHLQENRLIDYSCSNCKSFNTIINRKEVSVEPEILAVVLKRYYSDGEIFRKNEVEVNFPLENLKFGTSKYSCYSVVQHSGTMTCGHYFAAVKLDDELDKWYQFNDEIITLLPRSINESSYIRSTAAGFFYVRQE
ncbi:uncharacterized protein LOC130450803 [Diorhabda sublineata]|uniref:uncharacterized protein LOC130450803 n=1 Tax=Diorhabda sublineata TaxID=1163346 RepID=UPI0024E09AAF|nr:uncharacterized protein LOC130450803 [Diorhabda sublineata]